MSYIKNLIKSIERSIKNLGNDKYILKKEDLFDTQDLATQYVNVPEWGKGAVLICRALNALERLEIWREPIRSSADITFDVVMAGVVNEDGSQYFLPEELVDLRIKGFDPIVRLSNTILMLSGLMIPQLKKDQND